MHQKERIKVICELLEKNGYVTVQFLTEELHYSSATINRDLNVMQAQKLVKRSYGGVELIKSRAVPLLFRYNKMRPAKNKIGKKAAEWIHDGDTVFIDSSTTAQYIGKYITDRKNLTVITNNMALASFLGEHAINVICLGGKIVEVPSMLCGDETVEQVRRYGADKMFFSTGGCCKDGKIVSGGVYYLMHKEMFAHSNQHFFLVDHEKICDSAKEYMGTMDDVDYVISDFCFDGDMKDRYKNTTFIEV
ncbi:MAG: DeoR/GlpR transcriptional regulator [Clostridia bacterium]|nr:DeoR/GlpR transcriptional regulator [Clostridia bacterium]